MHGGLACSITRVQCINGILTANAGMCERVCACTSVSMSSCVPRQAMLARVGSWWRGHALLLCFYGCRLQIRLRAMQSLVDARCAALVARCCIIELCTGRSVS